jgi:hypothetical protein
MAHIQKITTTAGVRHQARWTDPKGKARTKAFARKSDAERFLAATGHRPRSRDLPRSPPGRPRRTR